MELLKDSLANLLDGDKFALIAPEHGQLVWHSIENVEPGTGYDAEATEDYTQVELYWTWNYVEFNFYFRADAEATVEDGKLTVTDIDGNTCEFNIYKRMD